ncbi:uncharacterized protein CLUP02_05754 [Colletotrichum lupini]|uniref:Uncharacterized protein n=1 Tax=Colletotrichum lupini TaxID=145971 RepID=A0A9Q8WEX1_9PEZI|nr:uncharacterized protein CLUP02_05754 [Colletotrichum lupini]UQC80272.1 hypothetical protein CLUP02_05754 [Colletotrichum lupini]
MYLLRKCGRQSAKTRAGIDVEGKVEGGDKFNVSEQPKPEAKFDFLRKDWGMHQSDSDPLPLPLLPPYHFLPPFPVFLVAGRNPPSNSHSPRFLTLPGFHAYMPLQHHAASCTVGAAKWRWDRCT